MSKYIKKSAVPRGCLSCGAEILSHRTSKVFCSAECKMIAISKQFSNADGCWEWPMSKNAVSGYGQLGMFVDGKHVLHSAHVLSYRTFVGDTGGLFVCHHCDNRPCFNPKHLFLGTVKDNAVDAMVKGRLKSRRKVDCSGENHPMAKITTADVIAIRESTLSLKQLAESFSLAPTTIWSIRSRKSWANVA